MTLLQIEDEIHFKFELILTELSETDMNLETIGSQIIVSLVKKEWQGKCTKLSDEIARL